MNKHTISIIIPTYKCKNFIVEAVKSALDQKVQGASIEIIVVDDGSPENEGALVTQTFGDQVKVLRTKNNGVAKARNTGLRGSSGDFICFLDGDDVLLAGSVEARYLELLDKPECLFVHGPALHIDEHSCPIAIDWHWPKGQDARGDLFEKLLLCAFIIMGSTMYRRTVLDSIGGFDEEYNLHASEDLLLYLEIAARGPVAFIEHPLVSYRVRPNSAMSNTKAVEIGQAMARLHFYKKNYKTLKSKKNLDIIKILLNQSLINGARLEKMQFPLDALKIYLHSLKILGFNLILIKPVVRSCIKIAVSILKRNISRPPVKREHS